MSTTKAVVKPFEVDDLIGTSRNRVARMGVELEGAWNKLPPDARLENDGSVFRNTKLSSPWTKGELPVGPFQPSAMPRYMRKYYPQKVDKTCGMHVHMSFETLFRYSALMVESYQETIILHLTKWAEKEGFPPAHHIYERLRGESEFCEKKFFPDMQVTNKTKNYAHDAEGNRYTIVHYCGRLMTIEVRVLPMMDTVEQAIRGVQHVVDITNACLVMAVKKEPKVNGRIELSTGEIYEEFIEKEIPLTSSARRELRRRRERE